MDNETYQPVPHDAAFRKQLLANDDVKMAFDANAAKYALLDELLNAKKATGLTLEQIATKMGTTKNAVTRLESALASGKTSFSVEKLNQYAQAVGKKIEIHLVSL